MLLFNFSYFCYYKWLISDICYNRPPITQHQYYIVLRRLQTILYVYMYMIKYEFHNRCINSKTTRHAYIISPTLFRLKCKQTRILLISTCIEFSLYLSHSLTQIHSLFLSGPQLTLFRRRMNGRWVWSAAADTLLDGRHHRTRWRRWRRSRWGLNCCIDGRAKMGLV